MGPQSDERERHFLSSQWEFPDSPDGSITVNLIFKCNEKFFKVILSRQNPPNLDERPNPVGQGYLDRLEQSNSWDGGPDDEPPDLEQQADGVYQELEDFLEDLLRPIFSERAPPVNIRDKSLPKDLQTYMTHQVFTYHLATLNGKPKLIPRDDLEPPNFHPPISDGVSISSTVGRYHASSIRVIEDLGRDWVLKVSLNGQIMCCKISNDAIHESLAKEYSALQKILDNAGRSTRSKKVRVPTLHGIVESHDGSVVGILIGYIPHQFDLSEALKTSGNRLTSTRKSKWASQIEETLSQIHAMDVVWGDAKSSNVLVDNKDDAWIVDFGGGQTEGWVDTALVDTKEGDLQALQKIQDALRA